MEVALKYCSLCGLETPSIAKLLSHLRLVHSHDPKFLVTCGLNGCATTSRSFSALYSHIYRRHPDIITRRKKYILCDPDVDTFDSYSPIENFDFESTCVESNDDGKLIRIAT